MANSISLSVVVGQGGTTRQHGSDFLLKAIKKMIPEMPALIPTNTLIIRPNIQANLLKVPESPQPPPQHPTCKISPSDEKLHKDLDDQIQLVKQIQTILGTEQMKLEMMLKEFHTRNMKRKQIAESHLATTSENPKCQPKRLRVCSPSSINRNMNVETNFTKAVEEQIDHKNPVEMSERKKSDTPSSCSDGGSQSSCSPSRVTEQLERFRNFWSGCNDIFEDDEIEIKEELNSVNIEDLVEEEINNRRKDRIAE